MTHNHSNLTHSYRPGRKLIALMLLSAMLIGQLCNFLLAASAAARNGNRAASTVDDTMLSRESATKSLAYLREVMDRFHKVFWVYEDVSSPGNHFHAWAKFIGGNGDATMNGSWEDKAIGATSIRCEFKGTGLDFAGFALLNGLLEGNDRSPRFNFGTALNAGFNLTGATTLKFRARGERGGEIITFFMGGVGREENGMVKRICTPEFPSPCPAPDSTPAITRQITLTTEWTENTIDLAGKNLSYVLGGFGWGASTRDNRNGAVFYLDDIRYELNDGRRAQRLNEPRLLRSFSTLPVQSPDMEDSNKEDDVDLGIRNTAFVYDNALALLAFLVDGSDDSVRRARLIGDALIYAFNHDRKGDGLGLRSMYAAGDISLPPGWVPNGRQGTAPASGYYDEKRQKFVELEENRSIDIGNQAWAMIALEALYQYTKNPGYLETAKEIGNVIRRYRQNTGKYQGFRRGIDELDLLSVEEIKQGVGLNKDNVRKGASAEHNLDIYAAFSTMFQLTGDPQWKADAEHARKLVEDMWDDQIRCYWAGTADTENIYKPPLADHSGVIPVDVQAWTVMTIPDTLKLHPQVLACAEQNHRNSHHGFLGFDFNNDRDGVWFEGTAHMAVAYALAGQSEDAGRIRAELRRAQQPESYSDRPTGTKRDPFDTTLGGGNGTPAACHDGLSSGFDPPPDPVTGKKIFHYHRRLHVGATAWNVFAQLHVNPYYFTGPGPALASAASYTPLRLAPESIAALFGSDLATGMTSATSLPLPTQLAGATVKIRDSANVERLAPLFFASPRQINLQIPPNTTSGLALVTATSGNGKTVTTMAQIEMVAPGFFSADATGQGLAAGYVLRVKADGSRHEEPIVKFDPAVNKFMPIPIDLGTESDQVFLVLFGTGLRFCNSLSMVTTKIGGADAQVLYAAPQGAFIGLDQVNLRLPRSLAGRGEVNVEMVACGKTANIVMVVVK